MKSATGFLSIDVVLILNIIRQFHNDLNCKVIGLSLLLFLSLYSLNSGVLHAEGNSFLTVNVHVGILASGCDINNNEEITVEFNRVVTERINGVNYRKPIVWALNCENTPVQLKLNITGKGSSFNSKALKTNKPDLGIMLYNENEEWPLDTLLSFTYPDVPKLYAVPIKNSGAVLDTGDFNASASLVVIYQ